MPWWLVTPSTMMLVACPSSRGTADREDDGADREDQRDDGTLALGSEIREEPAGRAAQVLGVRDRHPDAEAVAGVERPLEDRLGVLVVAERRGRRYVSRAHATSSACATNWDSTISW